MSIQIQEDCIGISVNPTLINPTTGSAIDLTTASQVIFRFLAPDDGAAAIEVLGSIDGDPLLGTVIYANDSSEFFDSGTWKYQVKVIFTGGQTWFSPISKVKVKSNL